MCMSTPIQIDWPGFVIQIFPSVTKHSDQRSSEVRFRQYPWKNVKIRQHGYSSWIVARTQHGGMVYSVINLATRKSCINVIGERPGYRIQGTVNPLLIEHLDFLTVGSWMFTSSSRSCENTRCRCAFEREIGICCYTVRHPGACGQVRPMRDGQEHTRAERETEKERERER